MSAVCPQGHTSSTADFCDVCGAPIEATPESAPSTPAGAPPAGAPASSGTGAGGPHKPCPNCQTENTADALFCEDCGYDFATGQLPPPAAMPDPVSGVLVPPAGASSGVLVPPAGVSATGPDPVSPAPSPASPPNLAGAEWVAEVWVDPDWFASQQAEGSCPSSGLPTVVALTGTEALIGRRSKSRGLIPDIDCTGDGAISHRHATLSLAGEQWSVEDLGSTNGTFVGRPDDTFPSDPILAQEPHPLGDDERIYVGAWTRIVVRRATAQEKAGAT